MKLLIVAFPEYPLVRNAWWAGLDREVSKRKSPALDFKDKSLISRIPQQTEDVERNLQGAGDPTDICCRLQQAALRD